MTLRPAVLADIPTLVNHRRWMFEDIAQYRGEEVAPDAFDAMDAAYRPFLEKHMAEGRLSAWIIEVDGKIAASAGIFLVEGLPHYHNTSGITPLLHDVYTRPEHRRQGLARRLVQQAIDFCRQSGYERLTLRASPFGRPLYEAMGFKDTKEMRLNF